MHAFICILQRGCRKYLIFNRTLIPKKSSKVGGANPDCGNLFPPPCLSEILCILLTRQQNFETVRPLTVALTGLSGQLLRLLLFTFKTRLAALRTRTLETVNGVGDRLTHTHTHTTCSVCFCLRKPPLSVWSHFKTSPDVPLETAATGDDRYSAFFQSEALQMLLILSWMRAGLLYNPLFHSATDTCNAGGGRECVATEGAQHGGCDGHETGMINVLLTLFGQTTRTVHKG